MKFSTADAKASQKKTRMNVGIHENVMLTSIDVAKSKSGAMYIEFNFENDKGEFQIHRIWEPNVTSPLLRDGETMEQAQQREVNDKLIHLVHILETFLPSDKAQIAANSFEDFCKIAKGKLEQVMKSTKIRIKLLLDNKNEYVQFPRFTPYMEKQVEGMPSKLEITEWEMNNRTKKANQAPTGDAAINTAADDMPF